MATREVLERVIPAFMKPFHGERELLRVFWGEDIANSVLGRGYVATAHRNWRGITEVWPQGRLRLRIPDETRADSLQGRTVARLVPG